MSKPAWVLAAVSAVLLSGCYHATVDTGRTPNGVEVRRPWAHSFIGGLVPPSTVETAQQCPNGVAKVETQMSFLNMLANGLTFGLYSPMEIRVQCAGPGTALSDAERVPEGSTVAVAQEAVSRAANRAAESGEAVVVVFE